VFKDSCPVNFVPRYSVKAALINCLSDVSILLILFLRSVKSCMHISYIACIFVFLLLSLFFIFIFLLLEIWPYECPNVRLHAVQLSHVFD